MRAVIQRVSRAEVRHEGKVVGAIGRGLLIFIGIGASDGPEDSSHLARKVLNLRIFEDEAGKMNRSVGDVQGDLLVVSQFTLYADCTRGNRPSFTEAAAAEKADSLYRHFLENLRSSGRPVATGNFRAMMEVDLVNEGPVTILLDTRK